MTTFDDRTKGYESAHAHEAEMSFAMEAKTCKHFGLWVADQLNIQGDAADVYATEVIASNLEEPGFDDVLRKVRTDLGAYNVSLSDEELNQALSDAAVKARQDVKDNE